MFPLPPWQQGGNVVAPGVTGGGQVNTSMGQGLQGYKPSIPAEAMQGVSSFMQNFMQMRQASREMNKQKFLEGVQFHQSTGIPISDQDGKKLMTYARRGGLDYLPTEPPTQQEQDYAQAQQAEQAQSEATGKMLAQPNSLQASAALSPTGVLSPDQQQTQDTLAAGPGPGQPSPTFGQRVLQGMGLRTPQVSNQSPMGQWLQSLSQASQIGGGLPGDIAQQRTLSNLDFAFQKQFGFPLKGMGAQKEMQMIETTRKAMGGDPNAIQMMARMSNGWQLPMDDLQSALRSLHPELNGDEVSKGAADLFLKLKMGYPQYQLKMLDIGKDMAQYFNNDPRQAMAWVTGQPGAAPPAWSPQQWEQFSTGQRVWQEAYPTVDGQFLSLLGLSYVMPGGTGLRDQLVGMLGSKDAKGNPIFVRSGSIELDKYNRTLQKDWAQVNNTFNIGMGNLNQEKIMGLRKYDQETFDKFWGVAMDTKQPTQARDAAWSELSKLSQKYGNATVDVNGNKVPIGNPFQVSGGWNWFGQTHSPFSGVGPYGAPTFQGDPAAAMRANQQLGAQPNSAIDPTVAKFAGMSIPERQAVLESMRKILDPLMFGEMQRRVMALPVAPMYGPEETPPYKPTGIGSLENK